MTPTTTGGKGVAASLAASGLFGLMYFYVTLLAPLEGMEVYGWRMLLTLPILTVFMRFAGYWPLVLRVARAVRRNRALYLLLPLSSFLIGVQFWLFLWAPINGKAMQVSLGYLLMPLVMVLCGRIFYGETLRRYQKIAVFFAAAGVANQVWRLGAVAPEALLVALGFPAYFILRRRLHTAHLGGMWFDILLMVPVAGYAVYSGGSGLGAFAARPALGALVLVLGVMSATAFACYILASRFLPLGLFGLLGYVEPVLLVCVALILGERFTLQEIPTYGCIGLGMAILAYGGVREQRGMKRKAPSGGNENTSH